MNILPCPFCGSPPELVLNPPSPYGIRVLGCVNDECKVNAHVCVRDRDESGKEAVEKWNSRSGASIKADTDEAAKPLLPDTTKGINVSEGIRLITAERTKQIEGYGFLPEGDADYINLELIAAATCYIASACAEKETRQELRGTVPELWPWTAESWKPSAFDSVGSRIRELVKAGALIAAEIDRLELCRSEEAMQ